MRVLLQRVSSAKVYVDGKLKGSCAKGLLIFVCAMKGDDENVVNPQDAKYLYELFIANLKRIKIPTQQGVFGASMKVELLNNGPATFWLDSNS